MISLCFSSLYLNFNRNCLVIIIMKYSSLLCTYNDENFIFLTALFKIRISKAFFFFIIWKDAMLTSPCCCIFCDGFRVIQFSSMFSLSFYCYCQSLISGTEKIFSKIVSINSFGKFWDNLFTKFELLGINIRFNCDESDLY